MDSAIAIFDAEEEGAPDHNTVLLPLQSKASVQSSGVDPKGLN